jgi:biopolymer transport protein ExbD
MRIRRLHKRPAALEITAFLNLIVVLVPFLLSTAVFSRLAVLELTLPAQSTSMSGLKEDLQLEIVIRPDALEVGDQRGGLIQRIPNTAGADVDVATLAQLMEQIKARFPTRPTPPCWPNRTRPTTCWSRSWTRCAWATSCKAPR